MSVGTKRNAPFFLSHRWMVVACASAIERCLCDTTTSRTYFNLSLSVQHNRSIATHTWKRLLCFALLLFTFFCVFLMKTEIRKIKRQPAQRRHAFAINFNICKLNKCVLIKSILFWSGRFVHSVLMKNVLATGGKCHSSLCRCVCVCVCMREAASACRENRTIVARD